MASPQEEEAIRAVVERMPAAARAEFERALRDPKSRLWGISDPAISQQVEAIYAMRAAETRERLLRASREEAARFPTSATVALAPSLPDGDGNAVLLRRMRARPYNLILVTNRTTPAELAAALGALDYSRREEGDNLRADVRMRIAVTERSASASNPAVESARGYLTALARASARQIDGVGRVPSLDIQVGPAQPK